MAISETWRIQKPDCLTLRERYKNGDSKVDVKISETFLGQAIVSSYTYQRWNEGHKVNINQSHFI